MAMTGVADIDDLLAAPKTIAGVPRWAVEEKGSVVRLVAPIARDGIISGLSLRASATRFTDPQRGSVALVFEGRPIQRLSIRPDHAHVNPFGSHDPADQGLRLPAGRTRLHSWRSNRSWPRHSSDNVSVAQPIEPEPSSFHEGLVLFVLLCGIKGDVPPPQWEPRFL